MRKYSIPQLKPGMVLGENIYSLNTKNIIFKKGVALDDTLIEKLKLYVSVDVLIDESISSSSKEKAQVPEDTRSHSEKLKETEVFKQFKQDFEETFSDFGRKLNDLVKSGKEIDVNDLTQPVFNLADEVSNPSAVFDMLHSLRQYNDETYAHSVNVSLISNALGRWMNLSEPDLNLLTQAALIHDVGKLFIPDSIIKKPGKLTDEEYEIIKGHTVRGYEFVKNMNIDPHIKFAVLQHHERCDGSGYPFGLKSDKIDIFSKYISVADVYDAVTSARVYRGPLCPFTAISILEDEGLQKYDTFAIMTFISNVINTYLFNRVKLSDGRIGDIVYINTDRYSRPTVRVGNSYVDLSKEKDLTIEAII